MFKLINRSDRLAIKKIADRLKKAIRSRQLAAFAPSDEKKGPFLYKVAKVAELTGLSNSTVIRRMEEREDWPRGRILDGDKRRQWTLSEIHKMQELSGVRPSKGNGKTLIITVAGFKGGSLKTTTATVLAQALSELGYRVLLIDQDPQGSASQNMGLTPEVNVRESDTLLPLYEGLHSTVKYAIRKTYWDGLDIVPASLSLAMCEQLLIKRQIEAGKKRQSFQFWDVLRAGLEDVKNEYDVVLIDTPPSLGNILVNSMWAADGIILPCPVKMLDVHSTALFFKQLEATLEVLEEVDREKSYAFVKVLMTSIKSFSADGSAEAKTIQEALARWMRQAFGEEFIMRTSIPTSQAFVDAAAGHKTVLELRPGDINRETMARASEVVRELRDEVVSMAKEFWEESA